MTGILKLMHGVPDRTVMFENAVSYINDAGQMTQIVNQDYKGVLALAIDQTPPVTKLWSEAWRIFIPTNFDKTMNCFTQDDWDALYRLNNYLPPFTRFAQKVTGRVLA